MTSASGVRDAIPLPVRVGRDGDTILDADGWSLLCEGVIRDQRTADELVSGLNARAALRALLEALDRAGAVNVDPALLARARAALEP